MGRIRKKLEKHNFSHCWKIIIIIIFCVGIWSWLADKLHFILSYEARFYKITVLKVQPSFCRITAYATMPD